MPQIFEKQNTMLYLKRHLVDQCKVLGVNISEMVNKMLEYICESEATTFEELLLSLLIAQQRALSHEMISINEKERRYNDGLKFIALRKPYIMAVLKNLSDKILIQQNIVVEVTRGNKVANLMRQINNSIRDVDYSFERVELDQALLPLLAELKTFGVAVNETWLRRQIERLARLET